MTKLDPSLIVSLACALLLTGCPDDGDGNEDAAVGDSSTGDDTGSVTTLPTTMTTMGVGTTGDDDDDDDDDMDTTVGDDDDDDSSTSNGSETDSETDTGMATATGTDTDTDTSSESTSDTGSGLECPDVDLGSTVPQTYEGSNVGFGDDSMASCAIDGGNSEDVVYQFTAPAEGTYIFDTYGSSIDTVVTLQSDCMGPEIACNDDAPASQQSELSLAMLADESVFIVVDGSNATGDVVLNIAAEPEPFAFGPCPDGATCGEMGEQCLTDMAMTVSICSFFNCAVDSDCPDPNPALGGTANVLCQDLNGDMVAEECSLDCSGGLSCPMGMECFDSFLCVWPDP